MTSSTYEIGMIGLGVMGRNLVLNMLDHGFSVAAYNRHQEKVKELEHEASAKNMLGTNSLEELVNAILPPRPIMLMVSAGAPVDDVISELMPLLDLGDLIIDGGNSHYKDTDARAKRLAEQGIDFLGVGISGGEKGARFGPSIMPGGQKIAYDRVRPILEAVAADVDGERCVTYLGPGSSGHYVKMVHNGIEYGLMQLISEAYDLMKRGLGLTNDELADVFAEWNRGELESFLVEITSAIFRRIDDRTGQRLIDIILDKAQQKGTGKWTSQDAMDLQVPVPTIDVAVSMRDLSVYKEEREEAAQQLCGPAPDYSGDRRAFVETIGRALHACTIITYVQGMALLRTASKKYKYDLPLREVARVWRGGCIIRSRVLNDIRSAFEHQPDLPNLMLDAALSTTVVERQRDLRQVVRSAVEWGIPVPGMMACISYFDGFRSGRLPANLIQAQRDYFGSHTYGQIDQKGAFHTVWDES